MGLKYRSSSTSVSAWCTFIVAKAFLRPSNFRCLAATAVQNDDPHPYGFFGLEMMDDSFVNFIIASLHPFASFGWEIRGWGGGGVEKESRDGDDDV